MKTIYLAGPIKGVEKESALWRSQISIKFPDYIYKDPTRPHTLIEGTTFQTKIDSKGCATFVSDANINKTTIERDLKDIEESDILLANFSYAPDISSVGTIMEIFYASRICNKPTIIVAGSHKPDSMWFNYFTTRSFISLEDAMNYIKTI